MEKSFQLRSVHVYLLEPPLVEHKQSEVYQPHQSSTMLIVVNCF